MKPFRSLFTPKQDVREALSIPKAVYLIKGKHKGDKDEVVFKFPRSKRLNGRIIASYSFTEVGMFRSMTTYWIELIHKVTFNNDKD